MKMSELIEHCKNLLEKHGDHEITRPSTGIKNVYKSTDISFQLEDAGWMKKKTITETQEIITKTKMSVYKINIDEDIQKVF